jgi:hypothetical protein
MEVRDLKLLLSPVFSERESDRKVVEHAFKRLVYLIVSNPNNNEDDSSSSFVGLLSLLVGLDSDLLHSMLCADDLVHIAVTCVERRLTHTINGFFSSDTVLDILRAYLLEGLLLSDGTVTLALYSY